MSEIWAIYIPKRIQYKCIYICTCQQRSRTRDHVRRIKLFSASSTKLLTKNPHQAINEVLVKVKKVQKNDSPEI